MDEKNVPLRVVDLRTSFVTKKKTVKAVDGVNFEIEAGKVIGIVGESGCGKSVTSLSIMHLLSPNAQVDPNSHVYLNGRDVLHLSEKEWIQIRGKEIAMIFQDPMTSLNPTMTIGKQIEETILLHSSCTKKEASQRALEMLIKVGIPSPELRLKEYPHQLSGGMKQRIMIAIALACNPDVLIADEPTTALDVTIQAQILSLLREIKTSNHAAIVLVSHDMGVVASMADYIMVMYFGKAVEYGEVHKIFASPKHPYTKGLLQSIPRINQDVDRLFSIKGSVPSLNDVITGCSFAPRCPYAVEACSRISPEFYEVDDVKVRCLKYAPETERV